MKNRLSSSIILACIIVFAPLHVGANDEKVVDKIAAIIGDQIILLSDVMKNASMALQEIEKNRQSLGGDLMEGKAEERIKETLDTMIDDEIFKQEAREMALSVTTEELDAAIENMARENNIDVPTLKQALKAQGMEYLTYRNQIRKQLTRYKVLNLRVRSRIKISDAEARQHYNDQVRDIRSTGTYEGAHILIRVPTTVSASQAAIARKKAESILKRLNSGESFESLAKQLSDDTATAPFGGSLGQRRKGDIPASLERAFFDLEEGETTGPVRTSAGFHLLKLNKREALGVMPFSEVKNRIIQDLQEEEMQRQAGIWLKERRSRMFIDIRI